MISRGRVLSQLRHNQLVNSYVPLRSWRAIVPSHLSSSSRIATTSHSFQLLLPITCKELSLRQFSATAVACTPEESRLETKQKMNRNNSSTRISKQRRSAMPPVRNLELLTLRNVHAKDTLEDHFEFLAHRHELSKFQFIHILRERLEQCNGSTCWSTAEAFFTKRKSIPHPLVQGFWNLIIAPTGKKKRPKLPVVVREEEVKILEQARRAATLSPIFWSKEQRNHVQTSLPDGTSMKEFLEKRSDYLRSIELEEDAKATLETWQSKLPVKHYRKLINGLQKLHKTRILWSTLHSSTRTHLHGVASSVADYLLVTREESNTSLAKFVLEDPRLEINRNEWKSARDAFCESFVAIQNMLVKEHAHMTKEAEKIPEVVDDYSTMEDSLLETYVEASRQDKSKNAQSDMIKVRNHIAFEALTMEWNPTVTCATFDNTPLFNFPSSPPTDCVVVIDNLPIDVTREQLVDAYSRCGAIQDIAIFHHRPELDPGRRREDSRKKIRTGPRNARQWERPRTPLYAMILFQTKEGAVRAIADPLRVFGMVLDQHLIRSHPAAQMTSLYLEDLVKGDDVRAMEFQLSQMLHPQLYVCLDVSRNHKKVYHLSIQFPHFEAAYWAYGILSASPIEASIQWMKTPADAMMYWTRKLNF